MRTLTRELEIHNLTDKQITRALATLRKGQAVSKTHVPAILHIYPKDGKAMCVFVDHKGNEREIERLLQ